MSPLGSPACSSPSGSQHTLPQSVTLATKRVPIFSPGYVDGFFQRMPGSPSPSQQHWWSRRGQRQCPHSTLGPSPVRIQGTGPAHCTQAWYPPLRTLSCQPTMWASSSQPHPCPRSPSPQSYQSGHKRQQKTIAFSVSSSVIQCLSIALPLVPEPDLVKGFHFPGQALPISV